MQQDRIEKEKHLSKHAINILINHAIFQFGGSLSIIFVNLYLWRLTNSLWVNGIYNLVAILSQAGTTFFYRQNVKKKRQNNYLSLWHRDDCLILFIHCYCPRANCHLLLLVCFVERDRTRLVLGCVLYDRS